jgi:hypothetical protein
VSLALRPWLHGAALGLVVLVLAPARADETRAQVEQRIRLAAQLIADSPAAQRISGSGNTQAVSHLDEGRLHQSLAEDALRRGDLPTARREVDDALRHVGMARRMVPNSGAQLAAAQRRHEQLLASLERLVEAWRVHAAAGEVQDGDLLSALGLIGTARYFADSGRHVEAVFTLELAERHVLSGMNRVLQQREIDYTQRASTPEQEFQLELQRHQAMAELLPLAVAELKPNADALRLIERYAVDSRSLRGQALQLQQGGDAPQALARLRTAMLFLQRGLQAAGVATPAPTDGTR